MLTCQRVVFFLFCWLSSDILWLLSCVFFSFQYRFSIEEERKWNPHQQSGRTWPCSWARRLNATLGKSRLFWKSRRPDLCRFGQPQSAASIASFIPISCWVGLLYFSFFLFFFLFPSTPPCSGCVSWTKPTDQWWSWIHWRDFSLTHLLLGPPTHSPV